MTKNTAYQLTVLTTRGISATKTYGLNRAGKIEVEGYGRAKTFTAEVFDAGEKGRWLRKLADRWDSFVVLGEPVNWKPGEKKRRLSTDRDGDEATLKEVPRALMPIDLDYIDRVIDFTSLCDIDDGERIAKVMLDQLGLKGVACAWHLTSGHGFFGKYRARLWVELSEPLTPSQMKALARERWGDEQVEVDGKRKNLVDFSVYQAQQPIYTADPILEDGIRSPVRRRTGFIDGDPLDVGALPRSKDGQKNAAPEDDNVALLEVHGLYIRRLKPGQHCIRCPWEEEHSGAERDDDTFYFEPHYNGHDIPAYKCHHDSCSKRRWADVLEHMGEEVPPEHDDREKETPPWVYVNRLKMFWDARDGALVEPGAYDAEHGGRKKGVTPTDRFLRSSTTRKVHAVDFLPGGERFVTRGELDVLNTYMDRRIEPDEKMDQTPWVEQMGFLVPDERERELLCDWMAWAYQQPGRKIRWAPVLFGPQGTGKTSVLAALGACIGADYEHIPTSDELKDKFTGWAHGKLLVRIEELMSGEGRYEIANRLKPIITNDDVSIRKMQREGFKARNFANVCASTNHINSIPVEDGDRRYMIVRTTDDLDRIKKNVERLIVLHRWLYTKNGLRAVAAWLANRNVDGFDYAGQAPDTEIKDSMREASENRLTRAINAARDLMGFDVITGTMLTRYLEKHDCGEETYRVGHIAGALNWLPMPRVVEMKQNRVWVGDRQEPVWSPTRSRDALKEFNRAERKKRAGYQAGFLARWIERDNAGPPRPLRVITPGAPAGEADDD